MRPLAHGMQLQLWYLTEGYRNGDSAALCALVAREGL